jgi:hypothetical protein
VPRSPIPASCRLRVVALVVGLSALASGSGCDTRVGADPAQRFLLDRLEIDTQAAEKAVDAHASPRFPCHAIIATVASFKNAGADTRARINHARLVCHDGSIAFARAQIAKLEAARRAREDLVEECFDLENALDTLTALNKDDPALPPLVAKRKTLCP